MQFKDGMKSFVFIKTPHTGKSFLEAVIFASTNPQNNKRLFMELP